MTDEQIMQLALELASQAGAAGEVPVAAVITDAAGQILATGANRTLTDNDPTAHAEIVALRAAAKKMNNHRLTGARMYVTLEPCAMCMGAMFHARVAQIVFAASDPKTGACGSVADLSAHPRLNHHAIVRSGLLAESSSKLLRDFFQQRRLK